MEEAQRLAVLVDAAAYFEAFAAACRAARQQIFILGWDFDRRERLFRDEDTGDPREALGAFLTGLLRRRRDLRIYLLSWDFNMIYAAERELLPALRLRLQAPPRFHFRLDGRHPSGASHHQKVVVVDDRLAFVGGIDLSRWRWDTPEHRADDPRRTDPNGKRYPPFHDMMMLVEGAPAARLGQLARERWRRSRGWRIPPVRAEAPVAAWPGEVDVGLRGVSVAISRTEPLYGGRPFVDEVKQLYLAAFAAARRFVYIENQYFTARELAEALARRLAEPDGPEVILVLPRETGGWLEQVTMDVLRARMLALMRKADIHDRLRVYYPHQPGLGEACIGVHAKLLIVDDRLLRIGSSNASSRSLGLDTECDLSVEAGSRRGERAGVFIRDLRRRLLAEHLGTGPSAVAAAERANKGLIGAVESLRGDGRSLRELDGSVPEELDGMVPDSGLVDPSEPLSPKYFVSEYVPEEGRPHGRYRLWAFLALLVGLLALAAAWRWTPLNDWLAPERLAAWVAAVSAPGLRAVVAVTAVLLASLAMVPLVLLAVVGGLVFEGWTAFGYVLSGALLAAMTGFAGGRLLSRGALERLAGSRLERLSRRLASRGVLAVAVLRLVPIAPFAVFNLVAGASHVSFWQFTVGSLVGLAPGLGAIVFFSNTLWEAVSSPSLANVAVSFAVAAVLAGLAWLARRWLRSG